MIPRNPASVFPLPVGDESNTDFPSKMAGTHNRCACVKSGYVRANHPATTEHNRPANSPSGSARG